MQLMRLIYMAVALFAANAYGEVISAKTPSAIKLGIDQIRISGPDHRTEDLAAVGLAWHTPWASWLRQTSKISYLSDYENKSQAMNVYHEVYQFYLGLELVYPWLFRWHVAGGPLFIKEKVHYDFKTDEETQRQTMIVNTSGSFVQVGLDYAFNDDMECTLTLGQRQRTSDRQSDFYYGFAVVWNVSLFWHGN